MQAPLLLFLLKFSLNGLGVTGWYWQRALHAGVIPCAKNMKRSKQYVKMRPLVWTNFPLEGSSTRRIFETGAHPRALGPVTFPRPKSEEASTLITGSVSTPGKLKTAPLKRADVAPPEGFTVAYETKHKF